MQTFADMSLVYRSFTHTHTEAFTHRSFYTHTHVFLLHTHTHTFTHRGFYTQTLTQRLLHTEAFTSHTHIHTDTLFLYTHTHFHTQRLLHTDTYTETFTHRRFYTLTQLCNPTAYLNLPPTSFFRPCAKVLFFQYPENFSGSTLKFRTWPFWGINGNGNHWVQTCETNIWWIFKPLALIHANKSTPSPNSWQGRIRI